MASTDETEEIETVHLVDTRIDQHIEDETFGEEETLKTKLDSHSREIRLCIVSIILIVWALLMIPYDIKGSIIHGNYVRDRTLFISSLYIWLIGHISVIISSVLSIITLKYWIDKQWIINIELLLILTASCLQVLGSICFAYSYCVNLTHSNDNNLWGSCVSKCHGLYLLYNAGFITFLGFIIFANRFNGHIPIVSIFVFKECWSGNNDDNACKFTKNFRVSFLSIFSLIGMILILVFGFDIYPSVGDSYQAIYIGYTFILFGTFIVILSQIIFHWRCLCCKIQKIQQVSLFDIREDIATDANMSASDIQIAKKTKKQWSRSIETVLNLAVYFLMFAGTVMIFMYSLVSKIPEAPNMVERVRLIGNMIIITGTGLLLCFELFSKKDNYDKEYIDHQYHVINDQEI